MSLGLLAGLSLGRSVPLSQPAAGLLRGTVIGTYRIVRCIGQGGMGQVYEARDVKLGRRVALKILHQGAGAPQSSLLLQEGRTIASLSHENFVQVLTSDLMPDGTPYLVMEYLEGQTLRSWLSVPRSIHEVLAVFLKLTEGMAFAHERHLVHRDIKPENVFLTVRGQVKILDLGLAGLTRLPDTSTARWAQLPILEAELAGTPRYIAPESCQGAPATARVDVWALGVMLYEALSDGRHPVWRDSASRSENVQRLLDAPIPPLPAQIPAGLSSVVMRALARDPLARFADAGGLHRALLNKDSFMETSAALSWRPLRLLLGMASIAVALIITLFLSWPASWSAKHPRGMVKLPAGSFTMGAIRSRSGPLPPGATRRTGSLTSVPESISNVNSLPGRLPSPPSILIPPRLRTRILQSG